jgi:DNA ligase 1
MQAFTDLYWRLDATTKTNDKVAALVDYFSGAEPADAAAAVGVLCGGRQLRAVATGQLRQWVAEETGLPAWLVEESYAHVGDLAETLALLLPDPPDGADRRDRPGRPDRPENPPAAGQPPRPGLAATMAHTIQALAGADEALKREVVTATWRQLAPRERIVWHKLVTGGLRVGVSRTLVARALADVAGIEPAVMAHRLMGGLPADAAGYAALLAPLTAADDRRPYPFFLASALDRTDPAGVAEELGSPADWQAEWKWDGMRAQIVRRGDDVTIWSRGEELVNDAFPELVAAAAPLPVGTVLDGELLAVGQPQEGGPLELLGFTALSRRSGRRRVPAKILTEIPCVFVAYDLLEEDGRDLRPLPLADRRGRLERLVPNCFAAARAGPPPAGTHLFRSPLVREESWEALAARRAEARERGVEGLMLKRRLSEYGTGRTRGDWWKWKIEPLEIDAVLIYAQAGHGRRAGLHSDYTLGLWDGDRLVSVAKAYSGLADAEIVEIDRIVRSTTVERHGPVRICTPTLVLQLAFEGVALSPRHKSGVAVRFPRIVRWRRDKRPEDAGRLDDLKRMIERGG